MEEGVLDRKTPSAYIQLIDMPVELREKFQFYTFAEGQSEFISAITHGNEEKMRGYVRMLIQNDK